MERNLPRVVALGAMLILGGCASAGSDPPSTTSPPNLGPLPSEVGVRSTGTDSAAADARTKRLQYVENTLELWHAAGAAQEYARRDSLAHVLGTYAAQEWPVMLEDFRAGSPRARRALAAGLGFSGRSEVIPALEESLRDPYYEVVLHGLLGLSQLAIDHVQVDPESVVPYLQHERPDVRCNAALVLGRTLSAKSPREYMLPLVAAAEDRDDATRVHAVAALGVLGGDDVAPHLVKALSDPVELVRLRSALALAQCGSRTSVPYLIEALARKDEQPMVRKAIVKALGTILGVAPDRPEDPESWLTIARAEGLVRG